MVILILSLILIGLAILERVVQIKKSENWDIVRLFIGVLIIGSLFLIAYFVTDTIIGLLYVFFTICIYFLLAVVNNRCHGNWINNLLFILGIPLLVYLLFNTFHNILIDFNAVILPILLTGIVLSYPYKKKHNVGEYISFIVGFAIAIALFFFYYKPTDFKTRIMVKQEIVAQNFLEEELCLYGLSIYVDYLDRNLRGEDTIVRAYNSSGNSITMIYRNNTIISYDIEN